MEKEKSISVAEEESLSITKSENLNLGGEKDNNGNIINIQKHICLHRIEESESDESNYEDAEMNLGMNRSDLVSGDLNKLGQDSLVNGGSDLEESRLNFSYSPTGYTTSELDTTDMTGLETTADIEGLETTTDMTDLETTTESLFTIDQTGYTDFDASNVTCQRSDTEAADTYRDERQTEVLNDAEEETCVAEIQKDSTSADVAESKHVEPNLKSKEEAVKDISVSETESTSDAVKEKSNQTSVTEVEDVLSRRVEEGSEISDYAYGIDPELNFEEEVYQSDDDTGEQVDSSFTNVTALTHPSISDTAHGSVSDEAVLVDGFGNRLANTNIASRMHSISTCETCGSDVSSYLDTTGCSSEFSFYVCYECQQLKEEIVPASDLHSDIDAADNNRSNKFSEVFEVAAESEEDKEYADSSNHAVELDIDNELPGRGHESVVEEISVLARQKEEQSALGQYSAVVLTPLDFKSETVDEKLKQESEYDYNDILGSGMVAKEAETKQFDTDGTEDQFLEQEITDTLDVLEPNKDNNIVTEIDKISTEKTIIEAGELGTVLTADKENGSSESKKLCLAISEDIISQAAGSFKEFHPVEILDEVCQILSDLQDMICGEESADAVSSSGAYPDNKELQGVGHKSNIHDLAGLDSKLCVSEGNKFYEKFVDTADISSNYEKETGHEPPLPPEYIDNITGIDNTVEGTQKYLTGTVEIEENLVMIELEKLSIDRKGTDQVDLDMHEKSADDCISEKETVDEHVDLSQSENVTESITSVDDSEEKQLIKESTAILNTQNSLYDEEELATAEHVPKKEQQPTADPATKENSDRIKIDNNQIDTDEIHTVEDTLLLVAPKAEGICRKFCMVLGSKVGMAFPLLELMCLRTL